MPPLDDNIEDLASSTDPTLDEGKGQEPAPVAVSSPAEGESDGVTDILSVVRDVVKDRAPSEAASPAAEGQEGQEPGGASPKAPDDEAFSDVPFNKHPRFQQLLRQRDTFKVGAERYDNVVQFLDKASLSAEEAADGLTIMGLMKTNPREAWERLQPTLQKLLVAAGEVPSSQLQARVNAGELTAAAALEISRAEARAHSVAAQRQWDTERAQRDTVSTQQRAVLNAVEAWEQDRAIKDPNFEAKRSLMEDRIIVLQRREGVPDTPEKVKDQLKRAYDEANKLFRAPATVQPVVQQRQAVKPVTGGQKAGNQAPVTDNMSTLDIVRASRRA